MPIRVGESLLEPGARGDALVPLGRRPDGSQTGVPVIGLAGVEPGPTLGIIAGALEGILDAYTVVEAPPDGEFAHVASGGFLRNQSALGAIVEKGQALGTIVEVIGPTTLGESMASALGNRG